MKAHSYRNLIGLLLGLVLGVAGNVSGEGPLTPPGAPAPTMKTLQEIWDRIGELQAQLDSIQGKVTIEMVTVGNAGNAADTEGDPNPAGAVSYEYKIGKYEVTNAQYAAFLNAVAGADPNALYNASMGSDTRGGISQSGTSPDFTYAVKELMGDKPVNFVSWYDMLRFCNWLHNGQRTGAQSPGTTEDGAYTMTGPATVTLPGTDPTDGVNGRNAGALYHLPSENEWYKAAYHEPGADANDYWVFPTQSNSPPAVATADGAGSINNETVNIANYDTGADWNGQDGNVTTVGSGGAGSASFYGAFDLGGNVWERIEAKGTGSNRVLRGGSWNTGPGSGLGASNRFMANAPGNEEHHIGFRVVRSQ